MIVYNITTQIDHDAHEDWLVFMRRDWIPLALETGHFDDYRLCRLLGVDEETGLTYTLQFTVGSRTSFDIYMEKHATRMQQMHHRLWKGRTVIFRTIMDVIEHG